MSSFPIGRAQPELYEEQLSKKLQKTQEEFAALYRAEVESYPSAASHYRMRAEFRIWHNDEGSHYAMYEPGNYKKPVLITLFDIAGKQICACMPRLLEQINACDILKKRLFQVEFLSTLSGELLVTLIYHRALDSTWEARAKQLENQIDAFVIGRSRKQKLTLSQDWVTEELELQSGSFRFQQVETGFTQPNANVNRNMLNWACKHSEGFGGDLLELYCGNGNFTIPLSLGFDKVLATELAKVSTRSAIHNIELNKRDNIQLVRLSAEEVTQAFNGVREFRRLKDINLDAYNFTTVFVDPPRAGIDEDSLKFIQRFENIIYISCNPSTLKSNLELLDSTHVVDRMALFDQFPYTDHRECGAILKKRT
ncbi:tRNA (uridine(54)-C5)-methyltransferase TrmA [Agaribacterium sp. ZY112]|uniref:tRNA (uridine(54)-C5)-methyltransferase TrmA n=1 Tax=Agaribacterium sp. ZY112 TaxID=3233574 RepID=UPI003524BF8E